MMNEEHAIGYHEVCTEEHVKIMREEDLKVLCKLQDSGLEYKKVRCFITRSHFRQLLHFHVSQGWYISR